MTRIKKLSTMLISALALSAIILTGGALGPNTPAAVAAQSGASCAKNYPWASTYFPAKGDPIPVTINIPSTNATSAGRNCLLGLNNSSPAVKTLQTAANLYPAVNPKLVADGIFGNKTKTGVKQMQGTIGVTSDGIYGNKTHNAMVWPVIPYSLKLKVKDNVTL